MITSPFIKTYKESSLLIKRGNRVLSLLSVNAILSLFGPFVLIIIGYFIFHYFLNDNIQYKDEIIWLSKFWLSLISHYILMIMLFSVIEICAPILSFMTFKRRIRYIIFIFIMFLISVIVDNIIPGFIVSFVLYFIMAESRLHFNLFSLKNFKMIINALISGLTTLGISLLLKYTEINNLLVLSSFIGVIMAILLDHISSNIHDTGLYSTE